MKRVSITVALCLFTSVFLLAQSEKKSVYYDKYYNCVFWNNTKRAQKLIDKGYSPDSRNAEGMTILLYCLRFNEVEWAEFFIHAGADVNSTDPEGNSCLHYAIENCTDPEIVYLLADKGARLDVLNEQLYSPFHFSILFKCPDLPFYFIRKGVNYKRITALNENALHLSLEVGCDSLTNYLLGQNINLFLRDNNGSTPLLMALQFNRVEQAAKLIDLGSDINMRDEAGNSCMFYTIANEDSLNFYKLLAKGVEIETDTALLRLAADVENKPMMKDLILNGAFDKLSSETHEDHYNLGLVYAVKAEIAPADSQKIVLLKQSLSEFETARVLYRKSVNNLEIELIGNALVSTLFYDEDYVATYNFKTEQKNYFLKRIKMCDKQLIDVQKNLNELEVRAEAEKVIEL